MSAPIRSGNAGKTYINIRIDQAVKQRLEQIAAQEGLDLPNYLRKHYDELVKQGTIAPEDDVRIQNPYINPYPQGQSPYPPTVAPPTPPYPYATGPYGYPQQIVVPDAMDQMINDMRKLVSVKMMKELLREEKTPEQFLASYQGKGAPAKDDFSMQDLLKYQMMMNTFESQKMTAQRELEMSREKGDKGGESRSLELITALTTAQMQQQQNFMQQFMLAQQNSQNVQQTLFTTALNTNREGENSARSERAEQDAKLEGIRNQMFQGQLNSTQQLSQVQLDFMNKEIERIRSEGGKKDILSQLNELLMLRSANPVYKAAFDAAFGVKDEGGIGSLIPKLKELGVDKVIDKVAGVLTGIVTRPPAIPTPTPTEAIPMPNGIPPPTPPTAAELERMHLPDMAEQIPTETVPIERPDNVGYSNLDSNAQPAESIRIEQPQPETQAIQPIQEQPNLRIPDYGTDNTNLRTLPPANSIPGPGEPAPRKRPPKK